MPSLLRQLADLATVVVRAAASSATTSSTTASSGRPTRTSRRTRPRVRQQPSPGTRPSSARPTPSPAPQYAPHADGDADPGEVVWAWVPYEEDATRGKDRPVLVVARAGQRLTTLMLTSKDHDRDAADEARYGRLWMDVGTGAWDRERRPSEVRLDRVIHLDAAAVRREGAAFDRTLFDQVVAAASELHDWS